jgi:hypothetical protein
MKGKISYQETGGRAQVPGAAHREIRVIRRKPDCLNPSLQKAQVNAYRKGACNRCRPCGAMSGRAAILRGRSDAQ